MKNSRIVYPLFGVLEHHGQTRGWKRDSISQEANFPAAGVPSDVEHHTRTFGTVTSTLAEKGLKIYPI
jgi:hypothetical protein